MAVLGGNLALGKGIAEPSNERLESSTASLFALKLALSVNLRKNSPLSGRKHVTFLAVLCSALHLFP